MQRSLQGIRTPLESLPSMKFLNLLLPSLLLCSWCSPLFSQATVAALNQNQLWAGIENPINVTSVSPFDQVRVTGGTATDPEFQGDRHASLAIVPTADTGSVSIALKLGDAPVTAAAVFMVRPLPVPAVKFGTAQPGDSLAAPACAANQLTAAVPDLGELVKLVWHGFSMSTMIGGEITQYTSDSDQLTPEMRAALAAAPKGAGIFFNRMAIETPDGRQHEPTNLLYFKQ